MIKSAIGYVRRGNECLGEAVRLGAGSEWGAPAVDAADDENDRTTADRELRAAR